MLFRISFFGCLILLTNYGRAADLLTTLRDSNASIFADTIESDPYLCSLFLKSTVHTVFAPIDSVLVNIPPSLRARAIVVNGTNQQVQHSYHTSEKLLNLSILSSLPATVNTSSDEVPANLPGDAKQVISLINGPSRPKDHAIQTRQDWEPQVQLVSGLGNKVNILVSGIPYDGGLIHTIDGLLTVPTTLSNTLTTLQDTTAFAALLNSSNRTASLDTQTGGTFFIPNNEALCGNKSLSNHELQNYVIKDFSGYLSELKDCQTLNTVNGRPLIVKINGGNYYINGSQIVSTNVILENGVAYVIDKPFTPTTIPLIPVNAAPSNLGTSFRAISALAFSLALATALIA